MATHTVMQLVKEAPTVVSVDTVGTRRKPGVKQLVFPNQEMLDCWRYRVAALAISKATA